MKKFKGSSIQRKVLQKNKKTSIKSSRKKQSKCTFYCKICIYQENNSYKLVKQTSLLARPRVSRCQTTHNSLPGHWRMRSEWKKSRYEIQLLEVRKQSNIKTTRCFYMDGICHCLGFPEMQGRRPKNDCRFKRFTLVLVTDPTHTGKMIDTQNRSHLC